MTRIYSWNEPRPCPGRNRPLTGRRADAAAGAGTLAPVRAEMPPRHVRRRAWALIPRAIRRQAPAMVLDWLPPRTRARLNRDITARNTLDRTMAAARGLAPDDPKCARFAGEHLRDALDRLVRKRRRVGLPVAPAPAMAAGMWAGLEGAEP